MTEKIQCPKCSTELDNSQGGARCPNQECDEEEFVIATKPEELRNYLQKEL